MQPNLKEFWSRLQDSVDVLVASRDPEHLLGVRDGFRRFFWHGLGRDVSVVVRPGPPRLEQSSLWSTAEQTLTAAQRSAEGLQQEETVAPFCVGVEEGFVGLPVGTEVCEFVHCWTVVVCDLGSARGSSGAIEIPARFTHPGGESQRGPHVPGTLRRGGMIGSLTGGLETRRLAVSHAVVHALSTVFYGYLEIRPSTARWGV